MKYPFVWIPMATNQLFCFYQRQAIYERKIESIGDVRKANADNGVT